MADNVISKIKLPDNQEYILKDSNAARSNHTHDISLEKDTSGTNQLTLAAGTKYKLTAGGESYIFTTPADVNNKVTIAADTTTNANYPLVFGSTNTSTTTAKTEGLQKSTTKFYVNPSTGNIQATTFNGITLAAAAAKSITDNSSNADVTSSDTNLITGRTLYYQLAKKGYTTNTGTVTNVATGAGLTGGPIATTGTISIATSGVTNDMLANSTVSIAGSTVSLGGSITADTLRTNLGLSTAMHFRGVATVAITDGSTTDPTISGYDFSKKEAGDVIIDSASAYEFVWTGNKWERLGPDGSYKLQQDAITSPTASGNSISFIDTISQNNNGVISATKKTIPDASMSTSGLITNTSQTLGGTKTFNGGAHFYGSINGSSLLFSGGAYDSGHNTIILHGDSAGVSGIGFTSQKATDSATITNINSPSDRAFIQYHAYGVTTQTADGTAPTLATSGEAGRLVIGVGNDAGDKILLQAPSHTDIMHTIGNTNYVIPDTGNQTGSVGGATTPVYVETGIIKAGTALKALAYKDSLTYSDVGAAASAHTHSTQDLYRPSALNGVNDITYQSLINDVRANRLAFLPADQIIIEKTTDGGTTWVDAGISDSTKTALFSQTRPGGVNIPQINGQINTLCGLRITITAMKYNVPAGTAETEKYNYWNSNYIVSTERYNQLKNMYFWVSSANNSIGVKVERATGANSTNWVTVFDKTDYGMTGWSGNDIINFSQGVFGGGTNQTWQYWNYRITLMSRGPGGSMTLNSNSITSVQNVSEIRGYGDTYWTAGNYLASIDHLYNWDYNKNAIFPADIRPQINNTASLGTSSFKWANVYATTFTGDLTGNATNVTGTVAIANGGTGKTTALDAANALISGLPIWTANPTDDTYLIRRDTGGTTTFGQVKFSTVWNYIKGKADSTYSANGHNHDSVYVKKADGVTDVTWTNKKITRTINGTTADVVAFEGTAPITVTGAANKLTIAHSGNSGYKHIPSGGSSGQFLGWDSDGTAKWVANPNTDTKVTSVVNHYTPAADTNAELTAAISGTAGTYAKDATYTVITGIKAQRDAKGHVTGITYTAQNIKDTNTTYTFTNKAASLSWGATTTIATVGGTDITVGLPANPNSDTKVTNTLTTTTKYYVTGTTSTTTNTGGQSFDTGVYVTTTAGEFSAMRHSYNVAGAERAYTHYNMTDQSIDFVFV